MAASRESGSAVSRMPDRPPHSLLIGIGVPGSAQLGIALAEFAIAIQDIDIVTGIRRVEPVIFPLGNCHIVLRHALVGVLRHALLVAMNILPVPLNHNIEALNVSNAFLDGFDLHHSRISFLVVRQRVPVGNWLGSFCCSPVPEVKVVRQHKGT